MSLTKRIEVNSKIADSVHEFIEVSREVIKETNVLNAINYDLRDLTTKEAVDNLKITVDAAQTVKKNWKIVAQCLGDIELCVGWYISRCNSDYKRYREKLNGEEENNGLGFIKDGPEAQS